MQDCIVKCETEALGNREENKGRMVLSAQSLGEKASAAAASRLADTRKSIVAPLESTARTAGARIVVSDFSLCLAICRSSCAESQCHHAVERSSGKSLLRLPIVRGLIYLGARHRYCPWVPTGVRSPPETGSTARPEECREKFVAFDRPRVVRVLERIAADPDTLTLVPNDPYADKESSHHDPRARHRTSWPNRRRSRRS